MQTNGERTDSHNLSDIEGSCNESIIGGVRAEGLLTVSAERIKCIVAPPNDECLRIEIPIALCTYDATGFYISFLMRLIDPVNRWQWHCVRRYSEFRAFHRKVGRHILPSTLAIGRGRASFPPVILTARSNREKSAIEKRRQQLERYMQSVLVEAAKITFNGNRKKYFLGFGGISESAISGYLQKLVFFIEHPDVCNTVIDKHDHSDNRKFLAVPENLWECSSTTSENIVTLQENSVKHPITATGITTTKPPPPVISTFWAPPPHFPGAHLGLCLPSAAITQNLRGEWHTVVIAHRGDRRARLCFLHDQTVALAAAIASATNGLIPDVSETKGLLQKFRNEHPILAYVKLEEELDEVSNISERKLSDANVNAVVTKNREEAQQSISVPLESEDRFTYEASPQSSRVLRVRSCPSLASLQSERERTALSASCALYSGNSFSRLGSHRDETCKHFRLRDDWSTVQFDSSTVDQQERQQQQPPHAHSPNSDEGEGAPWNFLNSFEKTHRLGRVAYYVDAVRGYPVDDCFCTDRNFCTSGVGDVYRIKNGYTIVVCPPGE